MNFELRWRFEMAYTMLLTRDICSWSVEYQLWERNKPAICWSTWCKVHCAAVIVLLQIIIVCKQWGGSQLKMFFVVASIGLYLDNYCLPSLGASKQYGSRNSLSSLYQSCYDIQYYVYKTHLLISQHMCTCIKRSHDNAYFIRSYMKHKSLRLH